MISHKNLDPRLLYGLLIDFEQPLSVVWVFQEPVHGPLLEQAEYLWASIRSFDSLGAEHRQGKMAMGKRHLGLL